AAGPRAGLQPYAAAGRRPAKRVVEQVLHDLADARAVGDQLRHRPDAPPVVDAPAGGLAAEAVEGALQELGRVHRAEVEAEAPGLEAGEVEEVRHQRVEADGLVLDRR